MNINPKVWGRDVWNFFYFVALSYPKNPTQSDKIKYKNFFELGGSVVPCEKCRLNFQKHIRELPIEKYLNSSYDLFTWVNKMDNKVRELNDRPQYSVEESMNYYMNRISEDQIFAFKQLTNKEKILIGLGIILLSLFVCKKIKII